MELFKGAKKAKEAMKEAMSMRSKFKEMDKKLKAKIIDVEYKGIKLQINGKNEFSDLDISEDLFKGEKEKLEKIFLEALREATQKVQTVMAEEAKELTGGLKFPWLS
jgi:DNA-binding protein YbaB